MKPHQKALTTLFILKHKFWVLIFIFKVCWALIKRGLKHDLSKFSEEEFFYVYRMSMNNKEIPFGTKEYYNLVDSNLTAKKAHYTRNSHHVEFYGNINKMSCIDLLEGLSDWAAATKRKGGQMHNSLDINRKYYKIDDKIFNGLVRDCKEIGFIE